MLDHQSGMEPIDPRSIYPSFTPGDESLRDLYCTLNTEEYNAMQPDAPLPPNVYWFPIRHLKQSDPAKFEKIARVAKLYIEDMGLQHQRLKDRLGELEEELQESKKKMRRMEKEKRESRTGGVECCGEPIDDFRKSHSTFNDSSFYEEEGTSRSSGKNQSQSPVLSDAESTTAATFSSESVEERDTAFGFGSNTGLKLHLLNSPSGPFNSKEPPRSDEQPRVDTERTIWGGHEDGQDIKMEVAGEMSVDYELPKFEVNEVEEYGEGWEL